jgi:hypothetical protein
LEGKTSKDMIEKLEKSLRNVSIKGKRRKRAIIRKVSATD